MGKIDPSSYEENINYLKSKLGSSLDLVFKSLSLGEVKLKKAWIIYIEGLVTETNVRDDIIEPLIRSYRRCEGFEVNNDVEFIKNNIFSAKEIKNLDDLDIILSEILSGKTIVFIDGSLTAAVVDTIRYEGRSISEPTNEATMDGAKDGFTEILKTNLSLIRRRLKTEKLKFKMYTLGDESKTNICLCYVEESAKEDIIKEVDSKINSIKAKGVLNINQIREWLSKGSIEFFPHTGITERPDRATAQLLEGKVLLLCEGSPAALTIPFLFVEAFQSAEDYYSNYIFASFVRILRVVGFFISILTPALYIAFETFHQEIIPNMLLETFVNSRINVPFPSLVESIIMITIFEIIIESGLRLPRAIGSTVSIVGTLIIGQAAVEAGIISAPMVIIGSLTGITSLMTPQFFRQSFFLRVIMMILSSMFGIYGIFVGILNLAVHVAALKPFGVDYLAPLAPTIKEDLKDSFIREPFYKMNFSPKFLNLIKKNKKKKGDNNG